jgi:uncharacterized protein YyaL (SSP411 family)
MTELSGLLDWRSWGGEAFAQAGADQKLVLLTVGVAWSFECAEMLRTTYQDEAVRDLIDRHFIPIWVDADERPDINDRYNFGGWPTTAFLTPDGQLLGGQTCTEPIRMVALLERVGSAYATHRGALSSSVRSLPTTVVSPRDSGSAPELDLNLERWLVAHLREAFDPTHGGFGRASKRIQEAPIRLILARCHAGDVSMRDVATDTLDAIGWGPLFDNVEGGVFRYAERRDWGQPHVEKLLSVNASAVQVFLDGWVVFNESRYRERAIQVIRYVTETLGDRSNGGFFASQFADNMYYEATMAERRMLESPPLDPAVYAGANSEMVRACVRGAELLGDPSLLECAVTTLERVVETCQRGQGVAHQVDDPNAVRGLLADQVAVSEALYDVYRATDLDVYLDLAQECMLFAMRTLWSVSAGAFVDRVVTDDDVGLLRHTITPFALNCRAAHVLARLSRDGGRADFRERARAALASQTKVARTHSVDAASYLLALDDDCFTCAP